MKKKLFAALLAAALLSLLVPAFATPSVGDLIRFCPTEIEVNYSSVLVKGYFVNLNTDYAVRNFRDFQMDVYKSGNKIVSGTFGTINEFAIEPGCTLYQTFTFNGTYDNLNTGHYDCNDQYYCAFACNFTSVKR